MVSNCCQVISLFTSEIDWPKLNRPFHEKFSPLRGELKIAFNEKVVQFYSNFQALRYSSIPESLNIIEHSNNFLLKAIFKRGMRLPPFIGTR